MWCSKDKGCIMRQWQRTRIGLLAIAICLATAVVLKYLDAGSKVMTASIKALPLTVTIDDGGGQTQALVLTAKDVRFAIALFTTSPMFHRLSNSRRAISQGRDAWRVRTIPVGRNPGALAVDASTGRVFVVNRAMDNQGNIIAAGTVSVLDAARGISLCTVAVGIEPVAAAVDSRTGRVFVINRGPFKGGYATQGSVSVFGTGCPRHLAVASSPYRALRTVALVYPISLAVDDHIGRIFVLNGTSLSVLDATSGLLQHTFPTGVRGAPPSGGRVVVIAGRSNSRLVVTNYDPTVVSILDAQTGKLLHALRVGAQLGPVAVDTRTRRLFVVDQFNEHGRVSVLDADTGALLRTTTVGNFPGKVVVDERTGRLFVLNRIDSSVSVLDARTGLLLRTVAVGDAAIDLAVDTPGGRVFVASRLSVSVLDATSGVVQRTLPAGRNPTAIAVDERAERVIVANQGPLNSNGSLRGNGSVTIIDTATPRQQLVSLAWMASRS